MVGICEVLQQTPLTVTAAPPFEVMEPPLTAEVVVAAVTFAVVSVAGIDAVVKVISFPYAVPTLFVA
jgi:hypothetical protein